MGLGYEWEAKVQGNNLEKQSQTNLMLSYL
jgi:hypothetical protein